MVFIMIFQERNHLLHEDLEKNRKKMKEIVEKDDLTKREVWERTKQ